MDKTLMKTILITILIAILGVYFLGKGITGLVISQSCCFPPDCDQENMCDAAVPDSFNTPLGSYFFLIFGFVLIAIAGVYFIWPRMPPDI